jgi:alkylation response protein AidB-like acyl-CoA dehydrogenase
MIDLDFTEEQKMFKKAIRTFAEKEIGPLVEDCEENRRFPVELFPKMGKLGYLGMGYPLEYGGSGADRIIQCIYVEELCRVCAGIASGLILNSSVGTEPIYEYGTEDQKQRYLLPAIKGEKISSFANTEPDAGSDVSRIQANAKRQTDGYLINGNKTLITNATISHYLLVSARTDSGKRTERAEAIGLFIVDRETPGLSTTKIKKMGLWSADTGEVFLGDCVVSEKNLIGGERDGFKIMMSCLNGGRVLIGARYVGIAQAAFEAALKYSKERVQFGKPISKFQAIKFKLADMAMDMEAARLLVYQAASLWEKGRPFTKEAAIAKLYASEMANRVTSEAIQIHGGYGYLMEYPVQRFFRDARVGTLHEGTSEIQRIVIARELGL